MAIFRLGLRKAPASFRYAEVFVASLFRNLKGNFRKVPSHRPCPRCEGDMYYTPTMMSFLTELYKRVCNSCGYVDPQRVKLFHEDQIE